MTRRHKYGTTIQTWPGGESFEYRGDPDGPVNQRSLRSGHYRGEGPNRWRKGTADEWRKIRVSARAEMYWNRDGLGCDSSLVDDLIKAASSGEVSGDMRDGFSYDEIRNLYRNVDSFDASDCREYAEEHGLDLPDVPMIDCPICKDETDGATCTPLEGCKGEGQIPAPAEDWEDDDSRHGWLSEARDVCRDHAQENPAEVYEWWRVSSWLCGQLHAIGEVTIDNGYGHWWGRTCSGQSLLMDGTLQRIAAKYEREEAT